ncbi:MAG TPA: hypothetical protein VHU23_02835 [Rhizomicrobium sp.]|jgi:hypothetical protein|nr:hypothetical protein [Rhizomicrobium sp.]
MRKLAILLLCSALAACAGGRQVSSVPQQVPRVALPPAPPPGEPADLAGLGSAQLRVALGAPAFVRKDGNAEMWRYDSASCKAFFFLYPYGNALLVRHVETVPRGNAMAADESCLETLRPRSQQSVS